MAEPPVVNIHQAKTHLSRLVERAERGERIVIGRAGRPVAQLVPYVDAPRRRVYGALKGQIRILAGFDDIDEEIAAAFASAVDHSSD
jgi:prevent-host-death family protein